MLVAGGLQEACDNFCSGLGDGKAKVRGKRSVKNEKNLRLEESWMKISILYLQLLYLLESFKPRSLIADLCLTL